MDTNNTMGSKILNVSVLVLLLLLFSAGVSAENRWINGTHSQDLGMVMSDEIRPRIYLADSANGELVVIDSVTEAVTHRFTVDGSITDMALSKDHRWLDVVANGTVFRIDLNKLKINRTYNIPVGEGGKSVRSVAFNSRNQIYAVSLYGSSQYDMRSEIYLLNWAGSKVIKSFGADSGPNFYKGMLKTDLTGTVLYVGEQGLSPLSIHKFDVLNPKAPVYLGKNGHGALGSNLRDFAISPRYNELYIASGSPYGIQSVDADTLQQLVVNNTGPYPAGTSTSPLGDKIYGIPSSPYNNKLYEFDAKTDILLNEYALLSNVHNGKAMPRGIAIDAYGEKAFVVHGDDHPSYASMELQVIDLNQQLCGN
ncbi:MAG: hypothetical protein KZQ93_08695 [Candidatus Thiodiazotropha sp. (ex Monitilora ramsayi)]|nr:hypothetical protein [Candidatus Thiodiazotropha sp. (ex Monitilora ramsayi)]